MNKYLIYYSHFGKKYYIIKLYKETADSFSGYEFDEYSKDVRFEESSHIGVSKKNKYCVIETDSDITAIFIFETLLNELEFTEDKYVI